MKWTVLLALCAALGCASAPQLPDLPIRYGEGMPTRTLPDGADRWQLINRDVGEDGGKVLTYVPHYPD